MRLALQRLLANSDALRYLRSTLRTFNGSLDLPTSGACTFCRPRLRLVIARQYKSLDFSLEDQSNKSIRRSPARNGTASSKFGRRLVREADNKANQTESEPHSQSSLKRNLGTLNKQLDRRASSDREQVIWRLLDRSETPNDSFIWLELAHARRRVHGIEGIRLVWKAMLERNMKLPTIGEAADELWNHLLQLGFEDPDILKEIFIYARSQNEHFGRAWPKLYVAVVGHYLLEKPNRAWIFHMRLHKHFPPSNQHIRQLFRLALPDEKLHRLFLSIHGYFPQARIYDIAIPQLCKQGLYATAVTWHKKLIERRDLPSSARPTEPVMQYLAATGQKARLMEYTRLMVAAHVSFVPYNTQDLLVSPAVSPELLNVVGNENDDPPINGYSDEFCARLMATRFFSIENIIHTLGFLRIHEIGPLALRELATRELVHNPYCRVIQDRLDQLTNASVSTGKSTFSILVRRLAAEGQSHLLANIVSCDLHTDTFDDHKLQESLLTFYHEKGDAKAFNCTMAILLARIPERDIPARRWNLILRSYLSRRELQAVKTTIEKMQDLQIQIEPKSTAYMRQTILSPRQVGRRPADTNELGLLIRIWQDILRSGGLVPPYIWTEIFRRLGMSGRLVMFERLALWLAAWYSSSAYRTSMSCLLSRSEGDPELLNPSVTINLKPSNPLHPLHVIFSRSLQQAIVAWGFQHTPLSFGKTGTRHRMSDWTWGLLLLRKLRESKVCIGQQNVSKAFKLRLVGLFGPENPKRRINRTIRQRNRESLGVYIGKAKKIWGSDLIKSHQRRMVQGKITIISRITGGFR